MARTTTDDCHDLFCSCCCHDDLVSTNESASPRTVILFLLFRVLNIAAQEDMTLFCVPMQPCSTAALAGDQTPPPAPAAPATTTLYPQNPKGLAHRFCCTRSSLLGASCRFWHDVRQHGGQCHIRLRLTSNCQHAAKSLGV